MYGTSWEFQKKANADSRHIQVKIEIPNHPDLTEDEIIGFELTESLCDNEVALGTANAQIFNLTCRADGYTFQSAHLKPYIGFDDEWCPLGEFIVADIEYTDGEYEITSYDKMAFADRPYTPLLAFPNTCANVMYDISNQLGFTVESTVYPTGELITGLEENCTYRMMIGYIAGLMGTNARFNRDGKLQFTKWRQLVNIYGDVNEDRRVTNADLTIINNELLGTVTSEVNEAVLGRLTVGSAVLGAVVKEKSAVADVNVDGIVDADDVAEIQAYLNGTPYPHTNVGQIRDYPEEIPTSRYYLNELTDTGNFTFTSLVSGTEEEQITSGTGRAITFANPYMTQSILDSIRLDMCPFTYDAGECTYICNPSYEVGDILRLNGRDFPLMSQVIEYNGGLKATVKAFGVSEEHQTITAHIPTLIEGVRQIGAMAEKVAEINTELNNAQGLYGGTYKELYGSDIDPSALSGLPIGWRVINNTDSNKWWQMTYNGLAFTNDGGQSYKIGITNTGKIMADDIVANAVLSNKITAQNLEITGGKIDITTADMDYDLIKLAYGASLAQLTPSLIEFSDASKSASMSKGKIYVEDYSVVYGATNIEGGRISCTELNAPTIKENGTSISSKYAQLGTNNTFTGTVNYFTGGLQVTGNIGAGTEISAGHFAGALGTSSNPQRVYLNPVSISPSNWTDAGYSTNTGGLGYQSSSRKYKKYIGEVKEERLKPERLYDLPVVQFKYRAGSVEDGVPDDFQIGFIAEDMDEIYPFACYYKDGDPEAWTGKNLIPAMLKLIQEQHAEIESLKEAVNELNK